MTHSILIMMFGQSNADAHNAGPSILSPFLDNPNVVVPNDGRGFQGLRGKERVQDITGFQPSYDPKSKIQSIGAALGCALMAETTNSDLARVIVRSAAQGGRPLHGHYKEGHNFDGIHHNAEGRPSYLFNSFVEDVRQMAEVARKDGHPIRHVYIPFFHGEADRAMARDDYQLHLEALMNDIDTELAALNLSADWVLTQPSGTGVGYNGNGWGNRICLADIAASRANAHLCAANYGYQLHDNVHLAANSKGLIGEALGHKIAMLERGDLPVLTQLSDLTVSGDTIDLHFDGPHDVVLDTTRFPAPTTAFGFAIARQLDQGIKDVSQLTPRTIRLTCARRLDGAKTSIDYAFLKTKGDPSLRRSDIPYAVGRGCLREDWRRPSQIFAGEDLLNWIPGFSVALSDIPALGKAA